MENNVMTIQKLKDQLEKMTAAGYGNLPIKLKDDVLHEDDFVFRFIEDGGMEIRGMLYNSSQYKKFADLRSDMEKAWEKFASREYGMPAMDQKQEKAANNLAKKIGSIGTMIAFANMNNSLGGFVRNQLNAAMRYEEEKVLKEKFGKEMEELE